MTAYRTEKILPLFCVAAILFCSLLLRSTDWQQSTTTSCTTQPSTKTSLAFVQPQTPLQNSLPQNPEQEQPSNDSEQRESSSEEEQKEKRPETDNVFHISTLYNYYEGQNTFLRFFHHHNTTISLVILDPPFQPPKYITA